MAQRITVTEREPDPGQQWKCGDEFLPFHPQSSVVPAEYRDGWNRCYWMAVSRGGDVPVGLSDEEITAKWNELCRAPALSSWNDKVRALVRHFATGVMEDGDV